MVDGSDSIRDEDWIKEQNFAKDAVAAFARRNIFDNGGSASYVQFSSLPLDMGTFYSEEDFDAHVDSLDQFKGGTDIVNGKRRNASAKCLPSPILREGCDVPLCRKLLTRRTHICCFCRPALCIPSCAKTTPETRGTPRDLCSGLQGGAELMNRSPASSKLMILITDGEHGYEYYDGDPAETAAKIRADGRTTIFVVGVGERENVFASLLCRRAFNSSLAFIQYFAIEWLDKNKCQV